MDEQTAMSLVKGYYDGGDYEVIVVDVDDGHVKHDSTAYYDVYKRKSDGSFWKVRYSSSYNYGLDDYSISVVQVVEKEVTKTEWVSVL